MGHCVPYREMNERELHTGECYGVWYGKWKKRCWVTVTEGNQNHRKEKGKNRSLLLESDPQQSSAEQMQQFSLCRHRAVVCNGRLQGVCTVSSLWWVL